MKKITTTSNLIVILLLIAACSGDDNELINVSESPKTGFLCARAYGTSSPLDTMVYNAEGGTRDMIGYVKKQNNPDQRVTLTPLGGGVWSLTRLVPYDGADDIKYLYFGTSTIAPNDFPAGYNFRHTLKPAMTADCELLLTRHQDNPEIFYLELKANPGNYLSPQRYLSATKPAENQLVYGNDKQAWFILNE